MDIILQSFNGILTVFIIITTGYILAVKGWFSEDGITLISRLVMQVCLPAYMLSNLLLNFQHDQLVEMMRGVWVPFLSMLAGYFISKPIRSIADVDENRKGIFSICVCCSNTIFLGLPLGIALFGEEAVPYIMIYYMANTTLFWTLGIYEIASDSKRDTSFFSIDTLKHIFSLPLMGFMLGVLMVIAEVTLPEPLLDACTYVGSMTTPLAMLFIGVAMSKTSWRDFKIDKQLIVAMAGRYFVCPVLVIIMLPYFALDDMMGKVFVIMSAMPAMTNTAIVAKSYGSDYRYAALLTAVSTCLAAVMIPFYMWYIH